MVLFDLVGDCDLQIPREADSDPELYALFADAAAELDGDPAPFEGDDAARSSTTTSRSSRRGSRRST